ncbi:hypothetical protein B7P43_G10816 [Cryptotermes secundus]|uniref:Uncharacterized protein n=1 Tax=Cryptotermes secundus TaxID=105785 RepID=A0A2J7PRX5_9NEOP|nr:hypothetical protein B7P43_G10816 [Cryptotermes secundus]
MQINSENYLVSYPADAAALSFDGRGVEWQEHEAYHSSHCNAAVIHKTLPLSLLPFTNVGLSGTS